MTEELVHDDTEPTRSTTTRGAPAGSDRNSLGLSPNGPSLPPRSPVRCDRRTRTRRDLRTAGSVRVRRRGQQAAPAALAEYCCNGDRDRVTGCLVVRRCRALRTEMELG